MGVNGIYGLSGSGLDIESMVKVGMMGQQKQLDKLQQKYDAAAWKKEAMSSIYSDLSTYNYSTLSQYKMQSTMNAMSATSSDESSVKVSANGSAGAMSHKVRVDSLSSNAYLMTADKITRSSKATGGSESSIYLGDSIFKSIGKGYTIGEGTTLYGMSGQTVKEGGNTTTTTYTLKSTEDQTEQSFKKIVTKDESGEESVTWKKVTPEGDVDLSDSPFKEASVEGKLVVVGKDGTAKAVNTSDTAVSFTVTDGTQTGEDESKYTVKYTYEQLLAGGKTFNDLVSDINALGTNIKATYDSNTDSFSLYNRAGGAENQINLKMGTDAAADLFNNLGMKKSVNGTLQALESDFTTSNPMSIEGDNGSITIDGKTYTDITDNRITVSGVTYTLQEVTEPGKTISVAVNQDTDAVVEKVKSFVEDYNKLLDSLYDKYNETKYSDYKPLTESQKEKMTEKQIEKWEEKAKSGLLYHDPTIRKILDNIRSALATPVEGVSGKYNSAYSLGIDTTKTNGHISLDEDKLKKALTEDSESVYKVFGTLPKPDEKGKYDFNGMGIAQRLGDVMSDSMKSVKAEAGVSTEISDGSNLGNKILEFQKKMSDFKTLMSAFESRLYKKYDAMESLLATLGAQMNFITGG